MVESATIALALDRLALGQVLGQALEQAPQEFATRHGPDALANRRAARRGKRGISLNVIPMIDVTFFLLVFFVCANKTLDREELLRTDLSQRGVAVVDPTSLALDEPPLRIELSRQDNRTKIKVLAPLAQPESFEQLTAIFQSKRYSPENPGGFFPSDQPIELAPGKDVPWEDAVASFNAIVRAGYQQLRFAQPQ